MKNLNSWLKVSAYSLSIAALAVFSYVTLSQFDQSELVQTNSFTGINVVIEDLVDGQYIHSGDSEIAAYKITFIDSIGLGNLQGFNLKLTPGNGATFEDAGISSSILKQIPDGLQIWKDTGGGDFDSSDTKLFTDNSTYMPSTGFYLYSLQLSDADVISTGDIYYLVFKPAVYGVTDGESVAIGIAANGISTSGISPTTDEVSATVTMDAAYPKVVQVLTSGIFEYGTLAVYFDQSMNPDSISSWAGTDPDNYFYTENPTTYASKTFGTGSSVAFSTNVSTNDIATITIGASPTAADGDRMWINFPNSLGYWFWEPILLDFTAPSLDYAYCIDANGDADCADVDDKVTFIFSEPMNQSTLTSSDIAGRLITSPGTLNTTSDPTVIWESNTQVSVILRAPQTSLVGSTILVLGGTVKDINGNAISMMSTTPTISIPDIFPANNVSFTDPDTTNWGIGADDISLSWEASSGGDHYNVYILPHDVALDTSVHNKLNSSSISLTTTTFVGSDSTYYLDGDSRSDFATYYPYHYYNDWDSYVAYVVVCNSDETSCSIPAASAPFVFSNDNSGSTFYDTYNWESTFVEGSFPWGWSTIGTNNKVFGLMFSDPMNADTITSTTLTLTNGTTPISGTVSYDSENWMAYFKTTESLPASSTLTFELSSSALDADANPVSYTTTFYTGDTTDTSAPTVSWASPYDTQTSVDTLLPSLYLGFNEQIDPTTVIAGNWSSVPDLTATTFYDPWSQAIVLQLDSSSLQGSTDYAITFSGTGIKDSAGNALGTDYILNFSTGAENTDAPEVNWIDFTPQGIDIGFSLPMK